MSSESAPTDTLPGEIERRCPFCGKDSTATLRTALRSGRRLAYVGPTGPVHNDLVSALYQCETCERASLLLYEESSPSPVLLGAWPRMRAHSNDALPPDVDADRVEAWNCYFGAEHRAAVVMARSALRRALRVLGAPRTDRMGDLVERGIVPTEMAAPLDAAGLTDPTPVEELGPVGESEAQRAIAALDAFLEVRFAPPSR